MKIRLRNEIQIDNQVEVVDQVYPVEVMQKKGQIYLIFHNEEEEKTVIKCDDKELVMTRFSTPKSIMRFLPGKEAIVTLHTPLGIQQFATATDHYQLKAEEGKIELHYALKQLEGDGIFATYRLGIGWS